MKTLYLDLFSGISGDMFIAALIDLGVDARQLETELQKVKLDGYHLHVARQQKSGIEGIKFDVHVSDAGAEHSHEHPHDHHGHTHGSHPHSHAPHNLLTAIFRPGSKTETDHSHADSRNFTQIRRLIVESSLSDWVKEKSLAVFQRIAVAEGRIHGLPPEEVHFHEVGAVDSIVDIVGTAIALELLGKPRVLASPVVEGTGWVKCAHGRFPVPTPATLAILGAQGIALTQCDEPHELITPTGAALIAEFVEEFGPMRDLVARKIGFGLGTRDNQTRPNVVRAVLADAPEKSATPHLDWETDRIMVLETNLDDISSEILGSVVHNAFARGALDVFHTPIQMKKNRPGVLLTVLCAEAEGDRFCELLLRETTAFGIRRTVAERRKLRRDFVTVKTEYGEVTVKLGRLNGRIVQIAPEFESCRIAAERAQVPIRQVYAAALKVVDH
jgi:uncharacterized protein (TIGR00299 family) protein